MAPSAIDPTYKAILLDIEGTTTSIAFVKQVLFPYAADTIDKFLAANLASDADIASAIHDLTTLSNELATHDPQIVPVNAKIVKRACENGLDRETLASLTGNIRTWIAQDKKLTPLKKLQGIMWEKAYVEGLIKGHVFSDVPPTLSHWRSQHIPIFIFSSGSVHAQKLLFQYSDHGDLTAYLNGYFDTNMGAKTESESYRKIASEIGIAPNEILFITDMEKEAIAAAAADFRIALSVRDGNAPLDAEAYAKFPVIHSFAEIPAPESNDN